MKARVDAIIQRDQAEYLNALTTQNDSLLAEMEAYAAEHRAQPLTWSAARLRSAGLSRATLSRTWCTIALPAIWCRTFGSDDFMRVPAPAARTTAAMGGFMGGRMPRGWPSRKMC